MLQCFRKGLDMTGQPIFNSGSHIGFAACGVVYLRAAMKRRQAKECESFFCSLVHFSPRMPCGAEKCQNRLHAGIADEIHHA